MFNGNVTVYKNHEDSRESWSVRAETEDGFEMGSVQIRRLTENRAIGFIYGAEVDPAETDGDVLNALFSKIVANAPRHNFALLQASAIAGSKNAETLESLGFDSFARFENPNTGNTLRLYGKTL